MFDEIDDPVKVEVRTCIFFIDSNPGLWLFNELSIG